MTCLGAYIVVDLIERWTGDKSLCRSVADKSVAQASIGVLNSGEECGVPDLKAATSRGVRFYHAVLKRVGDWHKDMPVQAEAVCGSLKNKRKRGQ